MVLCMVLIHRGDGELCRGRAAVGMAVARWGWEAVLRGAGGGERAGGAVVASGVGVGLAVLGGCSMGVMSVLYGRQYRVGIELV